jgi:hypothetical protein
LEKALEYYQKVENRRPVLLYLYVLKEASLSGNKERTSAYATVDALSFIK